MFLCKDAQPASSSLADGKYFLQLIKKKKKKALRIVLLFLTWYTLQKLYYNCYSILIQQCQVKYIYSILFNAKLYRAGILSSLWLVPHVLLACYEHL